MNSGGAKKKSNKINPFNKWQGFRLLYKDDNFSFIFGFYDRE